MLTMRDVANHVGVSVSAVSLVLNDRSEGRISEETAALIKKTARDMGYVPNELARSLKSRQTRTIGLLTDEAASIPFSGHLIGGAQMAMWNAGYLVMLIDTARNPSIQTLAVKSLLQRNIDGLIIAPAYHQVVDIPTVPESIPVVILDGRPSAAANADFVVPDEQSGAYVGTKVLLEAGHRRVAFCTAPGAFPIAAELREAGYRQALSEAGIPITSDLIIAVEQANARSTLEPAVRLLSRPDRPSAVFCFSDQIAMAFFNAAHRLGLRIPDDLSVVGFDNQEFVADALDPGLTTMQLPHTEMGEWAAHRLLARIKGTLDENSSAGYLMPCPLVRRRSVAPPSG